MSERQFSRRSGRGRPPSLSREQVISAGLDVLEEVGTSALSMRRVAERLDVGTMTLYGYFRDKRALEDALFDAVLIPAAQLAREAEGSWQERITEIVTATYEALSRHPGLVDLRAGRSPLTPNISTIANAVIGAFRQAGFDDSEASKAYRTVRVFMLGHANYMRVQSQEDLLLAAASVAALPEDEYPHLVATSSILIKDRRDPIPHFEFGLSRLLLGIEVAHRGESQCEHTLGPT